MKKLFTSVAIVCSLISSVGAFAQGTKNAGQDAATNKGDVLFDFGIGLVGNEYSYSSNYNYRGESSYQLPTFSLALQKAFWEDITIGGQFSINAAGSTYDDYHDNYNNNHGGYYQTDVTYSQVNSYFTARGEYHFNRLIGLDRKFDLYAGALVGFSISNQVHKYTEGWNDPSGHNNGNWGPETHKSRSISAHPVIGPFAGFRYYFANNVGVYGEVGFAITVVRLGLVWRL